MIFPMQKQVSYSLPFILESILVYNLLFLKQYPNEENNFLTGCSLVQIKL